MNWFEDRRFLKRMRVSYGLTQHKLAAKAGVKRSLIANIESGRQRLTKEVGIPLWRAIGAVEQALPALSKTSLSSLLKDIDREWSDTIQTKERDTEALADAIGHARSKNFPVSADVPTLNFVASLAADHARLTRRAAQQEELIRAYKRVEENLEKMIGLYQEALERQPELLRHWENEFKLRKEAEQSFRREIEELKLQLTEMPAAQNQEKDGD